MRKSLKKLVEGNKRFAEGKSIHPNLGNELRNSLLTGQTPFAAVIACSDSRVPVEIIFDVGLGDLFVIRSAGHVLSKEALGSLEYAVGLGVNLIVVMGHDNCGAINAALQTYKDKKNITDNLETLLNHIYPVFKEIDTKAEDAIDKAVISNINYQVQSIMKKDAYLAKKIKDQNILLVGAKYNLKTGLIDFFE